MIYEIVKSNFDPELIIFRDIDSSFDRCAWAMYEMLQDAGLHRNVYVGCFNGYENCIVFERENFRDSVDIVIRKFHDYLSSDKEK